jgi:hypothetical protein
MTDNPFISMAGDMSDRKKGKKGEAIARNAVWEDLGNEFAGSWSGQPTYWRYRKKYLKELADRHGMWLVHNDGMYKLIYKDKKGNPDIYQSKSVWDVVHKMRDKAKLRWLL